jgi:ubiquinone/menaquinone biosynthesis C-methylase UbiE
LTFKDHFSSQTQQYHDYRPNYPDSLFEHLFNLCEEHDVAWDCACGTGQASSALAIGFKQVVASDASASQIAQARGAVNIRFECFPAERSIFSEHSVDLISVAQALHWFEFDAFFKECKRVLKQGAPLVVWSYVLSEINENIDALVLELYQDVLGAYWPPERRLVENAYADIRFPFKQVQRLNDFQMQQRWSRAQFMGYLSSWSAVAQFQKVHYENPLGEFEKRLTHLWDEKSIKTIRWPLVLIVARD